MPKENLPEILGIHSHALGIDAGVDTDPVMAEHILVDEQLDHMVLVMDQPHGTNRARAQPQKLVELFLIAKAQPGSPNLLGNLRCAKPLLPLNEQ